MYRSMYLHVMAYSTGCWRRRSHSFIAFSKEQNTLKPLHSKGFSVFLDFTCMAICSLSAYPECGAAPPLAQ
jgi:hypothetical protein